ncbi:hypothetical protein AYK26_07340 [Euryarchaeota archaeon SM23-78]|nr:MAG: hypothetical protein AYK26_07340 [Euryarchaeota archaeon SM23-78]MBW3000613.1 hypothetical protein [Candidatus Woesearchaeota archaeon]
MKPELLQNLGLSKNESKIYTALVKLKIASVNEISRTTDVPRVNTYDVLESLKAKGLVASVTKSNKMYFEPANPDRIMDLFEKKQREMKEVKKQIEQLSAIFKEVSIKKEVGLYKGKLGLKTVLKDVLTSKTEILNYGSSGMFPKFYPEYFNIWEAHRIKKKISMRIVASKSVKGKVPKKKLQTIKFLNLEFKNLTSTFIYDNKVAIFMWTEDPIAILVENKELVVSYKNYFEVLWNLAK